MSTPPRESGIPLLTEIIEDSDIEFIGPPAPDASDAFAPHAEAPRHQDAEPEPAYPLPLKPAAAPAHEVSAPPAPASSTTPPHAAAEPPIPPAPQAGTLSEEEWMRMERRIRERILGQLLSRTDAMLEERIRNGISNMLRDAVDDLAAALRHNLHKTLDDVVSRAVAQEISRLQALKK